MPKGHKSTAQQRRRVRRYVRDLLADEPLLSVREVMRRAASDGLDYPWGDGWWAEQVRVVRTWHGIAMTPDEIRASANRGYYETKAELIHAEAAAAQRDADQTEVQLDGAKRLAAAVIKAAWDDADRILRPGFDRLSAPDRARIKYSVAWLQSPDSTCHWCDLLEVDPDMVASMSASKHGRPRFSEAEIEYLAQEINE